MQETFTVRLILYAIFQEVIGVTDLAWSVSPGTTVAELCDQLLHHYPALTRWRDQIRFGVNLEFVTPETVLAPGDEVVFIPPVSGG
ncbi:MAG: MoaD/ThiS family protein [Synechococcaceae cyanobacterium SM2_3_1]|nr:MoaD/ThiS family protein [Synechococcaceae cyanobacterium SM2_3_1]